jgi:large subunit ribosomal protein L22
MAFGAKTNERPGVRAQVRYIHVSASKARVVLDLIRGEQVGRALEILEFAERDVARVILKCLESAVANAEHNNGIPAEELFISACFADEGPTLKRFRPRARGRAGRIRKRTSHITIIVSRLAPEDLERLREQEASGGRARGNRAATEARRQRVLRSREAKAERKAAEAEAEEHDHDHDHDHDDEATDAAADETVAAAEVTDEVDDAATDEATTVEAEDEAPATEAAVDAADEAEAEGKDD